MSTRRGDGSMASEAGFRYPWYLVEPMRDITERIMYYTQRIDNGNEFLENIIEFCQATMVPDTPRGDGGDVDIANTADTADSDADGGDEDTGNDGAGGVKREGEEEDEGAAPNVREFSVTPCRVPLDVAPRRSTLQTAASEAGARRWRALHVLVDDASSADYITALANKCFARLSGVPLTVRTHNKSEEMRLGVKDAREAVTTIFEAMLQTVNDRLFGIIAGQEAYNTGLRVSEHARDPTAPDLIRTLAGSVGYLVEGTRPDVYSHIQRNMALIDFDRQWEAIKRHIKSNDDKGRAIMEYITATKGKLIPGQTSVSAAKRYILDLFSMRSEVFRLIQQDARIPVALTSTFGPGALILIPISKGNMRSQIRFRSAFAQILEHIRDADSDDVIARICARVEEVVMRQIRARSPVGFPALEKDTTQPIITVLDAMYARDAGDAVEEEDRDD